jgi:hypothetical protein
MQSCSHTNSRRLPPELVEHIIDYLYNSPEDLRSCALVCKAWVAPCRFHLFHTICFNYLLSLPPCRRLQSVIQRSPHVAFCVRELYFSPSRPIEDLERVELDTILPQIFRSFTRLRKLVLGPLSWDELTSNVKKLLEDILALPSLVHLDAQEATFPSAKSFLDLVHPQLKRLHGYYDYDYDGGSELMNREDGWEMVVERQPCHLEHLEWDCDTGRFIDWLLESQSLIDISTVRTLYLGEVDVEGPQHPVTRLLRTMGKSLEHLTINYIDNDLWGALRIFYLLHMFMRDAPRGRIRALRALQRQRRP